MEITPLEVKCIQCKKSHTRQVKVFEPEIFSKQGTGSILSQWWCPRCGTVNAIRYEFYRQDEKILARVKGRVEPIGSAFLHGDEDKDD
jgi:uncharacterized C2H2 Zn-finger protein